MILKAKPDFSKFFVPKGKCRLKLYNIVSSNKFEMAILICIMLNIISMGLAYEGASQTYNDVLEGVNYFFTAVFAVECLLKIIALGFNW